MRKSSLECCAVYWPSDSSLRALFIGVSVSLGRLWPLGLWNGWAMCRSLAQKVCVVVCLFTFASGNFEKSRAESLEREMADCDAFRRKTKSLKICPNFCEGGGQ